MNAEEVLEIFGKHRAAGDDVIAILRSIQNRYGCISEDALRLVGAELHRPLVDLHRVATFY